MQSFDSKFKIFKFKLQLLTFNFELLINKTWLAKMHRNLLNNHQNITLQ